MPEALRIAKRVVVTPGVRNIYLYPEYTWILSWVIMAGVGSSSWGFICWQPILVYGKDPFLSQGLGRRADTFMQRNNQVANVDHPCPKPDNVMRWIIERTCIEGETVLYPFLGSGTTGVACMQLNRKFVGIDMDSKYVKIAEKRISQSQGQGLLFTERLLTQRAPDVGNGAAQKGVADLFFIKPNLTHAPLSWHLRHSEIAQIDEAAQRAVSEMLNTQEKAPVAAPVVETVADRAPQQAVVSSTPAAAVPPPAAPAVQPAAPPKTRAALPQRTSNRELFKQFIRPNTDP